MLFLQTGPGTGFRPYRQGGEHASCLPRRVAAPCKCQTYLGLAVEAGGPPRYASVLSDPAPVSRVRTMRTMTHATVNREGQARAAVRLASVRSTRTHPRSSITALPARWLRASLPSLGQSAR